MGQKENPDNGAIRLCPGIFRIIRSGFFGIPDQNVIEANSF
jgi:hypothetical protein